MERLARETGNFRVLKIDIDTWGSPVAKQYDIHSLPTLWLYEGKERRATGRREVFELLSRDQGD